MKIRPNPVHLTLVFFTCILFGGATVSAQVEVKEADHPKAVASKGNKLLDAGKIADAYRLFLGGVEKYPAAAELLIGAGRAALLSGYADKSVEYLFKAIGLDPECYEANLYLGMALRQQGLQDSQDLMTRNDGYMMIEDALKFLRKAAELNRSDPQPCLQEAYALYDLYALDEADEAAASALKRCPDLLEALLIRGDLGYTAYRTHASEGLPADKLRKEWNHAMSFYKEANRIDKDNPNSYLGMAAMYEADKKWKESADTYREALLRNPELLQGYNQLITIFSRNEREEDGVALSKYLEDILCEIKTRFPGKKAERATTLYYIAFARFLESDFEGAIQAYRKSADLNSQYKTGAAYYMCRSFYELGDYDQSVDSFMKTMETDPEGLIYFMENDNEFAGKVYPALSYLAYHLVSKKKMEEAREMNVQILKVISNDSALYNNYAFLCRETGAYEDSYAAYRNALALDPENPSLLNDAALILHYHLHCDLDEAERLYEEAIAIAGKLITDVEIDTIKLDEVKTALKDATTNLRRLKRGILEERNGWEGRREGEGRRRGEGRKKGEGEKEDVEGEGGKQEKKGRKKSETGGKGNN